MIRILIAGDFCPVGRTEKKIENGDFSTLFDGFNQLSKNTDYAVVNLECPVTDSSHTIEKTGPNLRFKNHKIFDALNYAGFHLLTLANNHILDYGVEGVIDTLHSAKDKGFEIIGAGMNKNDAAQPLIKEFSGSRVGFINIAENEFCAATKNSAGANVLNMPESIFEIERLKEQVDKIIIIYHGGREHYPLPTPEQRKRFRYFIDRGADAVIGHHTHCVSGYELYKNKPLIYSLGNFVFDYKPKYRKGPWTEGMSIILTLENKESDFSFELIPHFQGREENPSLRLMTGQEKEKFLRKIEDLSKDIINDEVFFRKWNQYLQTQERFYLSSLYVDNIYLRALFIKGILPISLLRKRHNRLLLNLMRCETHHEISKAILEKRWQE